MKGTPTGTVDIKLYLLGSNEVVHVTTDSVWGWSYSGDYLLIHTDSDGVKTTRPYRLGDISKMVITPVTH